ncbi:hypothetical protein [Methylopila sp. 73B]|uniref:hypothetical protein n=1 Tax=Methylopila sp. 73B TaxID=1120792 RepID=UPI000376D694|nr:hypothetical protein [Methylopila sp. 73B]
MSGADEAEPADVILPTGDPRLMDVIVLTSLANPHPPYTAAHARHESLRVVTSVHEYVALAPDPDTAMDELTVAYQRHLINFGWATRH